MVPCKNLSQLKKEFSLLSPFTCTSQPVRLKVTYSMLRAAVNRYGINFFRASISDQYTLIISLVPCAVRMCANAFVDYIRPVRINASGGAEARYRLNIQKVII